MKKKIICFFALLLLIAEPCFALTTGSRRVASFNTITSHFDSANVISGQSQTPGRLDYAGLTTSPSLIYSISLTSTATNATLALFDNPIQEYGESLVTSLTVYPIWEMAVSVSGNTTNINFGNSPLSCLTGISLTLKNGQADIQYE